MKNNQFVIVGLGRFGSSLGKELIKLGYEVLGIDADEEIVEEMSDYLTHAVAADAMDEDVLRSLGVRNFGCGVVAIGDDIQASILTAILLKELGMKRVVAKAINELHGRVLDKIGIDRVIYPERDMGVRVAHQLAQPHLLDYIELSKDYTIAELAVPGGLAGVSLGELNPRTRFGCSVVAVHKRQEVIIAPNANDALDEKDVLVVIGTNGQIKQLEQAIGSKAR